MIILHTKVDVRFGSADAKLIRDRLLAPAPKNMPILYVRSDIEEFTVKRGWFMAIIYRQNHKYACNDGKWFRIK